MQRLNAEGCAAQPYLEDIILRSSATQTDSVVVTDSINVPVSSVPLVYDSIATSG